MFQLNNRQFMMFITVVVPLLFLITAAILSSNIWVFMASIVWMGISIMMLYLPKNIE